MIYVLGRGRIPRARLVMEQTLGHRIPRSINVHHINGVKDDDRPENLTLLTRAAHLVLHRNEVHYKERPFEVSSEAGKKGAASRWKNHVKANN